MVYFKSINAKNFRLCTNHSVSATGMLAATIAVGGFIVCLPDLCQWRAKSLMASATELVIAFVMGLGGHLNMHARSR